MQSTRANRRRRRLDESLLLALAIFAIGFAAGSWAQSKADAREWETLSESEANSDPLREAASIIEARYVDPVAAEALEAGALKGMADALDDPHSAYLPPALCRISQNVSGEFSGIGVIANVDEAAREIRVATVIPNTPAEAAGVQPGDVFHEVDGTSVAGFSYAELSALVPGAPGTSVTIVFKRGEALLAFEIARAAFELPNVAYDIIGDDIALVSMLAFHDLSRAQLDGALGELDINARKGLIFDIRGNSGGALASAVAVGSAFINDGALLRQVARDGAEEVTHASGKTAGIKVPIAVLVDETSASASEVIAGAMQDHGVAVIIGEKTFGKGTVQSLPDLSNGGCLRLTTQRWLTPNGHWIHEQGVTPDIIVEWDPEEGGDDPQLEAAIDYLEALRE